MKETMKSSDLKEILKYTEPSDLHPFLISYAAENEEFEKVLLDRFGPQKLHTDKVDYVLHVKNAFEQNTLKEYHRYNGWDEFGFQAEEVAAALQPLLDKANYYQEHKNLEEVISICEALIETIPEEWDDNFDYEGDVQVIYDCAIDKLQELFDENLLSAAQKKELFDWYSDEHKKAKHKDVGLDTDLKALEDYFTDTPDMLQQNLANIEDRIRNAGEGYKKQDAVLSKIHLLQQAGLEKEAEKTISRYLRLEDVRKLRLEKMLKEKQYDQSLQLIEEGIKIAYKKDHPGTAKKWEEERLQVYQLEGKTEKIRTSAEELFYDGNESRKYYKILKEQTPEKEWPGTVERLLIKMGDDGYRGINSLKAEILIEHKMWERLFILCQKAGVEHLEKYEKYLKPLFAKEIFTAYHECVEQEALITDKDAYDNVARVLKKMKKYEGGNEHAAQLVKKYREVYKRRKNMMKALNEV